MDGQQAQQPNPMEQLAALVLALNHGIQQLGAPAAPDHQPQQQQQQQPPHDDARLHRSVAADYGTNADDVATSWRELIDRLKPVSIPHSANINTAKPRGASAATKAELDTMARIAPVARALLQLYRSAQQGNLTAEQLAEAVLVAGLHLTIVLQQRQGDLFVETVFPVGADHYRALSGGSGQLAGEQLERLEVALRLGNAAATSSSSTPPGRGGHGRGGFNGFNGFSARGGYGQHRGGHNGGNYHQAGHTNHSNHFNNRGGYGGGGGYGYGGRGGYPHHDHRGGYGRGEDQ
jgi:hypothetical protein